MKDWMSAQNPSEIRDRTTFFSWFCESGNWILEQGKDFPMTTLQSKF